MAFRSILPGLVLRMRRLFAVPNDNPELTLAQFKAFSRQVPLLYFTLCTNMIALCWAHRDIAPLWLTLYLPGAFVLVCALRTVGWLSKRKVEVDAATAYRRLKSTNWLAGPIAIFCSGWSLCFLPYGEAYHRSHVAFFMAITVIGCIFCLMHLRSAALIVTLIVNAVIAVTFMTTGVETLMAMGFDVALVSGALIVILLAQYRDFRRLHESRQVLQDQQQALRQQNDAVKRLSDENLRLANLDSLTLIPNRRSFFEHLDRVHGRAAEQNSRFAVGVLDLDGFKPVNDLHGHAAGDRLLCDIAERMTALTGADIFVARLGGDEFGIVVERDTTQARLEGLGADVCAAIGLPVQIGAGSVQVTGSVGFAVYPTDGEDAQQIYEKADYALYSAKKARRGGTMIFNPAQAVEMSRQKAIEEAFITADLDEELSLLYQPIIEVKTGRCIGFEALARWSSPKTGMVPPAHFVPIAEHTGRIGLITRKLLKKALDLAATWPSGTFLSFNLSANDLTSHEGVLRLIAIIEASAVPPSAINLEITETSMLQDFEQARAAVEMLRRVGVGVALDDFGTGYSSLSQLHNLPLTKLKIDRSFVVDIETSTSSRKIVRSVLSLSADMGLDVIVEGVETEAQLNLLKRMGATVVQGFFYSPPIAADQTHAWLSSGRPRARRRG
ncbi:putative bifunctional diguanylate cyclase/phosphodiesterase [Rhizobium paknamense]|uniref:Diguanylate cyclase (GGDEF)-like protein n=1 Tax=Rhizobium paknamense TaxID=1206817 RepID=A0ABU0I9P1_9HYPH|nr:EAL domain-containing protein [Rhizobium paknamense]MDQ0454952.1 diguanylate cyclase (GGDEF)-like protein [Rhizobium paknamense]